MNYVDETNPGDLMDTAIKSMLTDLDPYTNFMNEQDVEAALSTSDWPLPDLCIRTGGERRISNFLLWQLAYAELYFSDLYWPDFKQEALREAFADFARRQRRFGKTSDQLAAES